MDVLWAAEAAAAGGETGGYWQLALMLAAIGFLGLFARWRKARQQPVETAREIRDRDTDPNRYRTAADRAIVELLETSRTLNAQVDTKIRLLNRLVKEAGEQSERLEKLLALAKALPEPEGAAKPEKAERPRTRVSERQAESGRTPAAEDETVMLTPEQRFMNELHERVYLLKEEGRSVFEIAKATNLSTTEVEFIMHKFSIR